MTSRAARRVIVLACAVSLTGCASPPRRTEVAAVRPAPVRKTRPWAPAPSSPTAAAPNRPTPSATAQVPAPVPTLVIPPDANPSLPQTGVLPSVTTALFHQEMQLLFAALSRGDPALAAPVFFPLAAYRQIKAITDPGADYRDRLEPHFALDVAAAHQYVSSTATLLSVQVALADVRWIPPGACYNRVGYWHLPGTRLVYREGGGVRSLGIAHMISWRGVWYVIHLGEEARSSDVGAVDSPALGPGTPGPLGGC